MITRENDKPRSAKLRIAVVGCGRISKKHFEAIQQHNDCLKLVAICEPKEEQRELMAKQLKARLSKLGTNDRKCTARRCSTLHERPAAEQTILAAKNGISIITEKPMATRWNDGLRMVKECDENNVKLFVVKQNRQNDTLKNSKQQLMSDALEPFIWFTSMYFGRVHNPTMIKLNGAELGNLMVGLL